MQVKFRSPFFLKVSKSFLGIRKNSMEEMGNLSCFLSGFRRGNFQKQGRHTPFTKLPLPTEIHGGDLTLKTPPTMVTFFLANLSVYILFLKLFHLYFEQIISEKENNFCSQWQKKSLAG